MTDGVDNQPPRLSIVVPAYNEEECLPGLVAEIRQTLVAAGETYELLLVDDGSTDRTPAVMRELAEQDSSIRILRLLQNRGQTAAFDAGFKAAQGEVVVTLDADGQNDPGDIPKLLPFIADFDAVCGIRARRNDSWIRRISSRVGNGVRNWATGEDIVDTGCSLKAFRRGILQQFQLFTGMHRFFPTLVRFAGGRIRQIEVNHRGRQGGTAKYGVGNRLFRTAADLLAVVWMKRRWLRYEVVEESRS